MNSPGGMSDTVAFLKWKLSKILDQIPGGYHLNGDNAYLQHEKVMTPFNKLELMLDPVNRDNYNFYLS